MILIRYMYYSFIIILSFQYLLKIQHSSYGPFCVNYKLMLKNEDLEIVGDYISESVLFFV